MSIVEKLKTAYLKQEIMADDTLSLKTKNKSFRLCFEALRDNREISINEFYELEEFMVHETEKIIQSINIKNFI